MALYTIGLGSIDKKDTHIRNGQNHNGPHFVGCASCLWQLAAVSFVQNRYRPTH